MWWSEGRRGGRSRSRTPQRGSTLYITAGFFGGSSWRGGWRAPACADGGGRAAHGRHGETPSPHSGANPAPERPFSARAAERKAPRLQAPSKTYSHNPVGSTPAGCAPARARPASPVHERTVLFSASSPPLPRGGAGRGREGSRKYVCPPKGHKYLQRAAACCHRARPPPSKAYGPRDMYSVSPTLVPGAGCLRGGWDRAAASKAEKKP